MSFSSLTPAKQDEILNGPALPPPDGLQSNFSNPPNQNAVCYAVTSLCLIISTVFVLIRLYTTVFLIRRVRIEDYLIIAGYGIFIGLLYCIYRNVSNIGFHVHQWDIRMKFMSEYYYVAHLCVNLYSVFLILTRSAILIEWIHLFVPNGARNPFYWTSHCLLWINVLFYGLAIILSNLTCFPFEYIWNKTIDGTCIINDIVLDSVSTYLNLFSDVLILILPQPVIWRLQMPRVNKIGVSIVFAIGILTIIASCFRVASVTQYRTLDLTYVSSDLMVWTVVETTCSLLVFCVPSTPRAWREFVTWCKASPKQRPTAGPQLPVHRSRHSWPSVYGTPGGYLGYQEINHNGPPFASGGYAGNLEPKWQVDHSCGIVRTTEVIKIVENITDNAASFKPNRIDPWM